MSNKERCIAILDTFTEAQLANIAAMLQAAQEVMDDEQMMDDIIDENLEALKALAREDAANKACQRGEDTANACF